MKIHGIRSEHRKLPFHVHVHVKKFNPFLPGGSPKNRQITQKNHNHLSKQQAVAAQIPTQFKQKLETIFI